MTSCPTSSCSESSWFPYRRHVGLHPLEYCLSAELPVHRRDDGIAWRVDRPFDDQSLGRLFSASHRKTLTRAQKPVRTSWQMDEAYIKVKGVWKYLYRAVDKEGKTVDFLLTSHRDIAAARRFFEKAMRENEAPEKIVMDKSGANKAAIDEINIGMAVPIAIRQVKYLNNIVEQDHRAIKRLTRPMLGFKSFQAAANVLAGIELMHMIRKGQFAIHGAHVSAADQFYALAGLVRPA